MTLHTDDADVGPEPLLPGTYVLDQPVRWEDDAEAPGSGDVAFDDGSAVVRVTYTVTEPEGGSDTPDDAGAALSSAPGRERTRRAGRPPRPYPAPRWRATSDRLAW